MQKEKLGITQADKLAEDAHASLASAAELAEKKIRDVRKRFDDAVESSKALYGGLRERAVKGAKAADMMWHEHPYQTIGIALGVGVVIGCFLARRRPGSSD